MGITEEGERKARVITLNRCGDGVAWRSGPLSGCSQVSGKSFLLPFLLSSFLGSSSLFPSLPIEVQWISVGMLGAMLNSSQSEWLHWSRDVLVESGVVRNMNHTPHTSPRDLAGWLDGYWSSRRSLDVA